MAGRKNSHEWNYSSYPAVLRRVTSLDAGAESGAGDEDFANDIDVIPSFTIPDSRFGFGAIRLTLMGSLDREVTFSEDLPSEDLLPVGHLLCYNLLSAPGAILPDGLDESVTGGVLRVRVNSPEGTLPSHSIDLPWNWAVVHVVDGYLRDGGADAVFIEGLPAGEYKLVNAGGLNRRSGDVLIEVMGTDPSLDVSEEYLALLD